VFFVVVVVHVEIVRCVYGWVRTGVEKKRNESSAGTREGATGDGNSRGHTRLWTTAVKRMLSVAVKVA
jgi:hypothetical protein